jgi:hypothetical protein
MKTYKNPKLREGPPPYKVTNQGPKPYSKPSVTTPAKHAPVVVEKPPVFELQNKKWPNLLGTHFCVHDRQVFGLHRLN